MLSLNEISNDPMVRPAWLRVERLEQHPLAPRQPVTCGFSQLLELRDLGTGIRSTRLAEREVRVARQLGLPENVLYQQEVAALLHDIGSIGIPKAMLNEE